MFFMEENSALSDAGMVDTSGNEGPARPKFKFLKRGEGTYKRVHAYKFRKGQIITESVSAKIDLGAQAASEVGPAQQVDMASTTTSTPGAGLHKKSFKTDPMERLRAHRAASARVDTRSNVNELASMLSHVDDAAQPRASLERQKKCDGMSGDEVKLS